MRAFLDCIPCLVRQIVDFIRYTTGDQELQTLFIRDALKTISKMELKTSPPEMAQVIHRLIRERLAVDDPYRAKKDQFNGLALEMYPKLKSKVQSSATPLETATLLAIAGNVIDLGANSRLDKADIDEAVEDALVLRLDGDLAAFRNAIAGAKRILYLTDNAGEIVFDRLLIEQLAREKVTAGVRGFPILNDATMSDAVTTGLTGIVRVIDNGSDAPGTILDDCSQAFRQHFEKADLVIAKGQGNYETLSEVEKDVFFLLKAKCPVIARDIGCALGSLVLRRSVDITSTQSSKGSDGTGNKGN